MGVGWGQYVTFLPTMLVLDKQEYKKKIVRCQEDASQTENVK